MSRCNLSQMGRTAPTNSAGAPVEAVGSLSPALDELPTLEAVLAQAQVDTLAMTSSTP